MFSFDPVVNLVTQATCLRPGIKGVSENINIDKETVPASFIYLKKLEQIMDDDEAKLYLHKCPQDRVTTRTKTKPVDLPNCGHYWDK